MARCSPKPCLPGPAWAPTSWPRYRRSIRASRGWVEMNGPDWDYLAYRLRRSPLTLLGLCMVALVLLAILVGPWLLSTHPDRIDLRSRLAAPSAAHWFGTDEVGRDIFTRVLHGGRISVGIGFFVVLVSATLGSILGGL